MQVIRALLAALLSAAAASTQAANDERYDRERVGRILSLVQSFARSAAESPDPRALQHGIDAMISGRNPEANRLAGELLGEMLEDMPLHQKLKIAAIVRDVATVAKRERARAAERGDPAAAERSLQARKDLHAMGLRYYDAAQFLDAVKRDDALAVELFVVAGGVNLEARDSDGASALDIARRAGSRRIVQLLASAGVK